MAEPAHLSTIGDLREKMAAATPLPWPEDYVYEAMRHIARNCDIESHTDPGFDWDRYNDSPLVTAALNALPALLDVAEAAQGFSVHNNVCVFNDPTPCPQEAQ